MKRRKKRLKKKKIIVSLLVLLCFGFGLIYLLLPRNYGYQKEVISVFKEENVYDKIKEKKKYSKTLEMIVLNNLFKENYLDEYLNINYVEDSNFLNNINLLLNLGYNNMEINFFYEKIPNSISVITGNHYDENITNYISLSYFKENNLDRYIKYYEKNKPSNDDSIEIDSFYDTSVIEEKYNYESTVTFVNAFLDKDYYANDIDVSIEDANKIDIIVNKYYKLSDKYEPSDLTVISSNFATGSQRLRKEAHDKFEEMASASLKEGIKIFAGSAYRSYDYQKNLYNKYVLQDGFIEAETYSARAGYSEHQLGLAVDILNSKWEYLSENDKEYKWLIENSYKYGFILRYPRDKEYITGYVFEDWHFRYLGIELADKVHTSNLTYDEYIARN